MIKYLISYILHRQNLHSIVIKNLSRNNWAVMIWKFKSLSTSISVEVVINTKEYQTCKAKSIAQLLKSAVMSIVNNMNIRKESKEKILWLNKRKKIWKKWLNLDQNNQIVGQIRREAASVHVVIMIRFNSLLKRKISYFQIRRIETVVLWKVQIWK